MEHSIDETYPNTGPLTLEDSIQKTRADDLWAALHRLVMEVKASFAADIIRNPKHENLDLYNVGREAEGVLMKWEE